MSAGAQPLESIAGFAALLRDHGLQVGVAEQRAMVQAALRLPIERAAQLDPAWRAIACHDARDWRRWPELFERYWHPQRTRGQVRVSGQTRPSRNLQQLVQSLHEGMAAGARRRTRRCRRRRAAPTSPRHGAPRAARAAPRRCTTGRLSLIHI